jgi:gamma-glutamylaminecyclotransferase
MSQLLFVYGTLKRGGSNHRQMAGAEFVGSARTTRGYRLFNVGGYPALVRDPLGQLEIHGELWKVDADGLAALDEFEGTHEGLFRREPIALAAPFSDIAVSCYFYGRATSGLAELGSSWAE